MGGLLERIRGWLAGPGKSAGTDQMRLIVGLGNPGAAYDGTRHNVGFEVVDRLAARFGTDVKRKKFSARVGEFSAAGQKERSRLRVSLGSLPGGVLPYGNFPS